MTALSLSARPTRFQSGRYLNDLFDGPNNGEMNERDPYELLRQQVGRRVRERRLELGLTPDQLAAILTDKGHPMLGASVSNWEKGDVPLKHVGLLAKALDVPWEQLVGLAPGAARPSDPLSELAEAVDRLALRIASGSTMVEERLDAIENRLPPPPARSTPRGRGTSAGGTG